MSVTVPHRASSTLTYETRRSLLPLSKLMQALTRDVGLKFGLAKYFIDRTANEGLHFVTTVLPKISQTLLLAIEIGNHSPFRDRDLRKFFRISGGSPLRVHLASLFTKSGEIILTPGSATKVAQLLQVCDFYKKFEVKYDAKICYESVLGFVRKNDSQKRVLPFRSDELPLIHHIVDRIFPFGPQDQIGVYSRSMSDGPGTFSRESPTDIQCALLKKGKRNNNFRIDMFATKNFRRAIRFNYPEGFRIHSKVRRGCAVPYKNALSELLLVPKTASKARVIVREPQDNLRVQNMFFSHFTSRLNSWTNGRSNIHDQTYNQEQARLGSLGHDVASLDISNGSNCVNYTRLTQMFSKWVHMLDFVKKCRTDRVFIPINWEIDRSTIKYDFPSCLSGHQSDHVKECKQQLIMLLESNPEAKKVVYGNRLGYSVPLYCLAGMGSYLTFPWMMAYFYVAIIYAHLIESGLSYLFTFTDRHRRKLLNRKIDEIFKSISIYGDDINLPKDVARSFVKCSPEYDIEINRQKSFIESRFRESCGPFYLNGFNITPIRLSLTVHSEIAQPIKVEVGHKGLLKLSASVFELGNNGLPRCSRLLASILTSVVGDNNLPIRGVVSSEALHGKDSYFQPDKGRTYGISEDDLYTYYWMQKEFSEPIVTQLSNSEHQLVQISNWDRSRFEFPSLRSGQIKIRTEDWDQSEIEIPNYASRLFYALSIASLQKQ